MTNFALPVLATAVYQGGKQVALVGPPWRHLLGTQHQSYAVLAPGTHEVDKTSSIHASIRGDSPVAPSPKGQAA